MLQDRPNSARCVKKIINLENGSSFDCKNCKFIVNELNTTVSGHNNISIDCANSKFSITYCAVKGTGYDLLLDNTTHTNNAINLTSSAVSATKSSSSISFLHYEGNEQYDTIVMPTDSSFTSLYSTLPAIVDTIVSTISS